MSETFSLGKLVKQSVARDISGKSFLGFYEELEQKKPISDDEFISELLEVLPPNNYAQKTQIERKMRLGIELSLCNDARLRQFWNCLPKTDVGSQISYLRHFNTVLVKQSSKVDKVILKLLVNSVFGDYILTTVGKFPDDLSHVEKDLFYTIVIIGGQLYDKFSNLVYKDEEKLNQVIFKLINKLRKANLAQLSGLWVESIKKLLSRKQYSQLTGENYNSESKRHRQQSLDLADRQVQIAAHSSSKSLSLTNISGEKLQRTTLFKEYCWFHNIMRRWRFSGEHTSVLTLYIQLFIDAKDKKNLHHITCRILRANFISFAFLITNNDNKYILYNWKNFIVSRLPKLLASLRFNDDETFEKAILDTFNSLSESIISTISNFIIGSKKQYDLRQSFIKSCILNKLLTIHSFQKIFPLDSKINQQLLVNELGQANQELNLQVKFNEKLLNINPEFTSLEESELMEFMNTLLIPLEYLDIKQLEFTKLILKIMEDLINEKNNEKLFRLLISILNNGTVLNLLIFNSGPYELVNRLIDYLDQENFNCEDEENFQDQYGYFGVMVLTVITIIDAFKLDIDRLQIKSSFVVDYINNFYFGLGHNLTNQVPDNSNQEDTTIARNYSNLLTDWINALFDESNDGLYDDLIKSITIKQIYKLIPIVYQQAIIACKSGKINFSILTGGIDYLTQMFLIPCTISLINWLINEILDDKSDSESLLIRVLYEIIKSNLGDESSNTSIQSTNDGNTATSTNSTDSDINRLIFKIVLRISGSNILHALKLINNWEKSTTIKKIVNIITNQVPIDYLDTDKSFKNTRLEMNTSEALKKCLSEGIVDHGVTPALSFNLQTVKRCIEKNKCEFIELIIDEINSFQKTNDEDTRIYINTAIFLMINSSINSNEEKKYWIDVLSSPVKRDSVGDNESPKKKRETRFILSMDSHYSSIFNDNNTSGANSINKGEKDDNLFGDFIEDDDLFTDKQNKPRTSLKLQDLHKKLVRYDNYLCGLQIVRYKFTESHRLHKAMNLLIEKIIDDLSDSTW